MDRSESTALLELQLEREARDEQSTQERAQAIRHTLMSKGKLASTAAGKAVIEELVCDLAQALEDTFRKYLTEPERPGVFRSAIPLLFQFDSVDQLALATLVCLVNSMGMKPTFPRLSRRLGEAIEAEIRADHLREKRHLLYHSTRRWNGKVWHLLRQRTMESVGLFVPRWSEEQRLVVGSFLVMHVLGATDLLQEVHTYRRTGERGSKRRELVPTEAARKLLAELGTDRARRIHGPMVVPAQPWTDLFTGGFIGNRGLEPLVILRESQRHEPSCYGYLKFEELGQALDAVNYLQSIPLWVDPGMVELLREAWDSNVAQLFPCGKTPPEPPQSLGGKRGPDVAKVQRKMLDHAQTHLLRQQMTRLAIERELRAIEPLKGMKIWNPCRMDFRGRVYSMTAEASPQGSSRIRAALGLGEPKVLDEEAFRWLLRSAAGQFGQGLDQAPWEDRLRWGQDHLPMLRSMAEAPLDRTELWGSAKDPWSLLQTARAIADWLEDPSRPSHALIRLDHSCSSMGHVAAQLRDEPMARLTNLIGDTREDLYTVVLERAREILSTKLEADGAIDRSVERAIALDPDRQTVKDILVAAGFGGTFHTAASVCIDRARERGGWVPPRYFMQLQGRPGIVLAQAIWQAKKDVCPRAGEIDAWLRLCLSLAITKGRDGLEWIGPSGLPIRVVRREFKRKTLACSVGGLRYQVPYSVEDHDAKASYRLSRTGIGGHFAAGIEAGMLHQVAQDCEARGIPLLTCHDAFSVSPADAGAMLDILTLALRAIHTTDWLAVVEKDLSPQLKRRVPRPPARGLLKASRIGENRFVFH